MEDETRVERGGHGLRDEGFVPVGSALSPQATWPGAAA